MQSILTKPNEFEGLAISKVYHFDKYDIFLRKDNIIQFQTYDGFFGDLNDGQNIVNTFRLLKGNEKCLVLIVVIGNGTITKENREFIASAQVSEIVKADAFVINSLGVKLLMNGYLKINKPNRPTRFFNSIEPALEWLKQLK
jgi:hypothetical protein